LIGTGTGVGSGVIFSRVVLDLNGCLRCTEIITGVKQEQESINVV